MAEAALGGGAVVITGATTGIGRATALSLPGSPGRVILHGIEPLHDVESLLMEVRRRVSPAPVDYVSADFGDLRSVERLAEAILGVGNAVGLLINNAGRPGPAEHTITADGHEVTFQTNYLAPVLLTTLLLGAVGNECRVVNIASATHHSATLQFNDLASRRRPYSPSGVYAHSKLALVTYTCWLAANRPRDTVQVVSMHPGVISTGLLHSMFAIGGAAPQTAAENIWFVASHSGDNGAYYDERSASSPNPEASDIANQARLHEITMTLLDKFIDP